VTAPASERRAGPRSARAARAALLAAAALWGAASLARAASGADAPDGAGRPRVLRLDVRAPITTAGIHTHSQTSTPPPPTPSTLVEFRGGFAPGCGLDDVELSVNHWVAPEVRV
jgi:hypothetical protein